jgi:hypothetical protein
MIFLLVIPYSKARNSGKFDVKAIYLVLCLKEGSEIRED